MALVDMFLKLDGVEGESKDASGKGGWIQIDGFLVGATSPRDSFTNQAKGAVRLSHLTIKTKIDKATPKLFDKITKNEKIPKATLSCRKAGKEQFEYFKDHTLTDVLVARVQAGDAGAVQVTWSHRLRIRPRVREDRDGGQGTDRKGPDGRHCLSPVQPADERMKRRREKPPREAHVMIGVTRLSESG